MHILSTIFSFVAAAALQLTNGQGYDVVMPITSQLQLIRGQQQSNNKNLVQSTTTSSAHTHVVDRQLQAGGSLSWTQIGDIAALGDTLAMSGNGMVIAASNTAHTQLLTGQVNILKWDGVNSWELRGGQAGGIIEGIDDYDQFGWSVDLSLDGNILAVATHPTTYPNVVGYVKVFEWDGTSYIQMGSDIAGVGGYNTPGNDVVLSDDGLILAIGIRTSSPGLVRVYEWNGLLWVQRGGDINGVANGGSYFGNAIALNGDGSIVAIGDPLNNNDMGLNAGQVKVYSWNGSSYTQKGNILKGSTAIQFGSALSLSTAGDILAVGAPFGSGSSGKVYIYEWDSTSSLWDSDSPSIILGQVEEDKFGIAIDISSAGTVIVIGANGNNVNGEDMGKAHIFSRNANSWDQVGSTIYGSASDLFGTQVAISSDGNVVAASADSAAYTRVYTWDDRAFPPESGSSQFKGPWNIDYYGFTADFSVDSMNELVLQYSIGKSRVHNTQILAKDCESVITGVGISMNDSIQTGTTQDLLSLAYNIDKSSITASNIWNNDLSKIELCQVIQLILPSNGNNGMMVIAEDTRIFAIDFDLTVNFSVDNGLRGGTIENEDGQTNVTSYVESCKCGGLSNFTCNTDDLDPNGDLYVCIKSASAEIEIDFLNSMYLTQGATTLPVIESASVSLPTITSRDYVPAENGVVVATRVPSNLFNYTEGNSIAVSGELEMKFAFFGRRLQANIDGSDIKRHPAGVPGEDEMTSSFELQVALQTEAVYEEGDDVSSSSAKAMTSTGMTLLALAYSLLLIA